MGDGGGVSAEQARRFAERGFVVLPGVLTAEEVAAARAGFHETLRGLGVDVHDLEGTGAALEKLSSTSGSGGVLDLFYFDWKLQLNEHPKVVAALQALWRATYAQYSPESGDDTFRHPFGSFDPDQAYMYIDRVGFRLPDELSRRLGRSARAPLQRSLTPHLDCCPALRFEGRKWRPVQAFLPLTDTLHRDEGGFEVCPDMHRDFDAWAATRRPNVRDGSPAPCVGQFTPIRPQEDREVLARMEHVPLHAGDLVCWDYRLAHSNALRNALPTPREVAYVGLLPAVEVNRRYAEEQLALFRRGELPNDQWHSCRAEQRCSYEFSALGRRLMAMEPWPYS